MKYKEIVYEASVSEIEKLSSLTNEEIKRNPHILKVRQLKNSHVLSIIKQSLTELETLKKHNEPMKPLKDGSYDICPICKECLPAAWANVYRKHCGNCGQALDWSEEI